MVWYSQHSRLDLDLFLFSARHNGVVFTTLEASHLPQYSYQRYCPGDMSDVECGAMISGALAKQTSWIREAQPAAKIITYLWSELLSKFKAGLLIIPEGVEIVFTDAGQGRIGGLDDIHLASGIYYHTAMLDGGANQITEMVSPGLIFSQMFHVYKNASKYVASVGVSLTRAHAHTHSLYTCGTPTSCLRV